jgi:hypothetical protein
MPHYKQAGTIVRAVPAKLTDEIETLLRMLILQSALNADGVS